MKVVVSENLKELGKIAAAQVGNCLHGAISKNGSARMVVSTGASQFALLEAMADLDLPWDKVDIFHLDEYIGIGDDHKASFCGYIQERIEKMLRPRSIHYISGKGNPQETIKKVSDAISQSPVDLGLIGIGENAHIAFNDPPADFSCEDPYIVVNLTPECKMQQVGEGWFPTQDDVPKQAITMSVQQILKCKTIISFVPYKVKAKAAFDTLTNDTTNKIPATILKEHADCTVYLDGDSASLLTPEIIKQFS